MTGPKTKLRIQKTSEDVLNFDGMIEEKNIHFSARRKDVQKDLPLLKRGFRWISEAPYNR